MTTPSTLPVPPQSRRSFLTKALTFLGAIPVVSLTGRATPEVSSAEVDAAFIRVGELKSEAGISTTKLAEALTRGDTIPAPRRASVPLTWLLGETNTLLNGTPLDKGCSYGHARCGTVEVGAYHQVGDGSFRWSVGSLLYDRKMGYAATSEEARAAVQSAWDSLLGAEPAVQPIVAARPVLKPLEWIPRVTPFPMWNAMCGDRYVGTIHRMDDQFGVTFKGHAPSSLLTLYPTLEFAQAAVQTHWDAFIRGALS